MAKQLVIISGKGGTGKTFISAALCSIATDKVIVDADVDAADLFLLLNPTTTEKHLFSGGNKAVIKQDLCQKCGYCRENCRFAAIQKNFIVDEVFCEGCGFCAELCPHKAIEMHPAISGEWYVSTTKFGTFVHAKLGIAAENSGKLVSTIKNQAKKIAKQNNNNWIIMDGPPGIGCPVIACLAGADTALIITEPTQSGLQDAERVIKLAQHFGLQIKLVINKYDLNKTMTKTIELYCAKQNIPVIGKIKFAPVVVNSIVAGKTITEMPDEKMSIEIKATIHEIWNNLSA